MILALRELIGRRLKEFKKNEISVKRKNTHTHTNIGFRKQGEKHKERDDLTG